MIAPSTRLFLTLALLASSVSAQYRSGVLSAGASYYSEYVSHEGSKARQNMGELTMHYSFNRYVSAGATSSFAVGDDSNFDDGLRIYPHLRFNFPVQKSIGFYTQTGYIYQFLLADDIAYRDRGLEAFLGIYAFLSRYVSFEARLAHARTLTRKFNVRGISDDDDNKPIKTYTASLTPGAPQVTMFFHLPLLN